MCPHVRWVRRSATGPVSDSSKPRNAHRKQTGMAVAMASAGQSGMSCRWTINRDGVVRDVTFGSRGERRGRRVARCDARQESATLAGPSAAPLMIIGAFLAGMVTAPVAGLVSDPLGSCHSEVGEDGDERDRSPRPPNVRGAQGNADMHFRTSCEHADALDMGWAARHQQGCGHVSVASKETTL